MTMPNTAIPAAETGLPGDLIAQMRAASDRLARARWLAQAFDMALSHPDALPCVENLPIQELAKIAIEHFVNASGDAEDALTSAVKALASEAAA